MMGLPITYLLKLWVNRAVKGLNITWVTARSIPAVRNVLFAQEKGSWNYTLHPLDFGGKGKGQGQETGWGAVSMLTECVQSQPTLGHFVNGHYAMRPPSISPPVLKDTISGRLATPPCICWSLCQWNRWIIPEYLGKNRPLASSIL